MNSILSASKTPVPASASRRLVGLDLLRGLSIFGMVFSAIVPHKLLPGWMYHVQNPPPTHALDMTVPGISWVDWVFPIFIFCMGVAIPLAGRRRLEAPVAGSDSRSGSGYSQRFWGFFKGVISRFFLLWLFAYLVVLLNPTHLKGFMNLNFCGLQIDSYDIQALILVGFFALFAFYWVRPKGSRWKFLRWGGALGLLGLVLLFHFGYGAPLDLHKRSIIILLLAFLYLFGSLLWYFSRNSVWRRVFVFLGILVITVLSKETGFDSWLYAQKSLRWVLNMEEIYFLLILLPATWVGDYFCLRPELPWQSSSMRPLRAPLKGFLGSPALCYTLLTVVALAVGFGYYAGWSVWGLLFGLLLPVRACIDLALRNRCKDMGALLPLALLLFVIGLVLYMFGYEGGLKKVPATLSYCFTMGGLSVVLLLLLNFLSEKLPGSFFVRTFSGAGANPLMSYVAFGQFVVPLMNLSLFIYIYQWVYPSGWPWIGVLRAFLIVLFTMWLVAIMSRRKLYWRA